MVVTRTIELNTKGHTDVIDISGTVGELVAESGVDSGIATIFCPGSTGGITTIEFEPGAISDLKRTYDEIVPPDRPYEHNKRWGDGNGHSHVRSALVGPSLTVPFLSGELQLGTWQQIIFCDFDNRPRSRRLLLQIIGE